MSSHDSFEAGATSDSVSDEASLLLPEAKFLRKSKQTSSAIGSLIGLEYNSRKDHTIDIPNSFLEVSMLDETEHLSPRKTFMQSLKTKGINYALPETFATISEDKSAFDDNTLDHTLWSYKHIDLKKRQFLPIKNIRQNVKMFCHFCSYYLQRVWMNGENWIFISVIAIVTGFAATYTELCTRYLSDIRLGFCSGMPLLTRSVCCGGSSMIDFKTEKCRKNVKLPVAPNMKTVERAEWVNWNEVSLLKSLIIWPNQAMAYSLEFFLYVLISVLLALTAVFSCKMFAPLAAGSGIPEVKIILSGFVLKGALSGWTGIIKIVGLSLGASSGLSLGKEGPLVQIACCCAIVLFNNFSVNKKKKTDDNGHLEIEQRDELLSVASACGVSVAFGAPLGGVLFSLEEISLRFPLKTLWKTFFGAVLGVLTLKWINTTEHNSLTLFPMDSVSLSGTWIFSELIPFALIGFLGATVGRLFIQLNTYWHSYKFTFAPKLFANPFLEVIFVTALCNVINFPFTLLKAPHSVLLQQMFSRCGVDANTESDIFDFCSKRYHEEYSYSDYCLSFSIFFQLTCAIVVRIFETVLTFGLCLPAGIFFPSLMIGALMGRFVGLLTIQLNSTFNFIDCHKCIHPGVYAIVGAASTLSGITGVTISVVVIMFELTGGLSYAVPFMVSVMIAKWSADLISKLSIYDYLLRSRGYPYNFHSMSDQIFDLKVRHMMTTQLVVITAENTTIESLEKKIQQCSFHGFPLVESIKNYKCIGYIPADNLKRQLFLVKSQHPHLSLQTKICFCFVKKNNDQQLSSVQTETVKEDFQNKECHLDFSDIVSKNLVQVLPEMSISQMYLTFLQFKYKRCFVVHLNKLKGLLTRRQCFSFIEACDRFQKTR